MSIQATTFKANPLSASYMPATSSPVGANNNHRMLDENLLHMIAFGRSTVQKDPIADVYQTSQGHAKRMDGPSAGTNPSEQLRWSITA